MKKTTKERKPKKKQNPASPEVIAKKVLIGKRIKELRGDISQDAVATAGGTSRRVVGEVERGTTDYRIESLLAVIHGLERQLGSGPDSLIEKVVFAPDSMESDLVGKLVHVLRHGTAMGKNAVLNSIELAMEGVKPMAGTARSGPTGRSIRSA